MVPASLPRIALALTCLLCCPPLARAVEKPRLVVLIVFDQMRGDYLTRWRDLYVEDGFRRLTTDGAWFVNCHYPYAGTLTGPGHATIATGCPPKVHGIIANEWWDRKQGKEGYCVANSRYEQIPPATDKKNRGIAPTTLQAPAFADALKEQLGEGTRVVALSLKDRSAVLPGGKFADACYWADKEGRFVTSTYYRDRPHAWVTAFNNSKLADSWAGKTWERLRADVDYVRRGGPDDQVGAGKGYEQGRAFPHRLDIGPKKERANYYNALGCSPFGNDVLLALAKKAIEAEKLGTRPRADLLCISFSSNDLIGHVWGPDSQEVLDVTLRSDLLIKDLLTYLDAKVGKGKYVVAMTADHGICPLPEVARSKGFPARRIDPKLLTRNAEEYLDDRFPARFVETPGKCFWIEALGSGQVYLDRKQLARRGVKQAVVEEALAGWLVKQPGIQAALTRTRLESQAVPADELEKQMRLSWTAERGGDVTFVTRRHCFVSSQLTGTTHGSPHDYDTHVPLVVMGPGVKAGVRKERVSPEHAAAILARVVGIDPPAQAKQKVPEGLIAR